MMAREGRLIPGHQDRADVMDPYPSRAARSDPDPVWASMTPIEFQHVRDELQKSRSRLEKLAQRSDDRLRHILLAAPFEVCLQLHSPLPKLPISRDIALPERSSLRVPGLKFIAHTWPGQPVVEAPCDLHSYFGARSLEPGVFLDDFIELCSDIERTLALLPSQSRGVGPVLIDGVATVKRGHHEAMVSNELIVASRWMHTVHRLALQDRPDSLLGTTDTPAVRMERQRFMAPRSRDGPDAHRRDRSLHRGSRHMERHQEVNR
jgi:hypothetical protein